MIPPGAFLRRRGWGTTGSSHRYAMRKLRTQAIGQVRPRARDPRGRFLRLSRSTRSLGSAGDAPPPAGGEGSVFRPKSAPQFPPLRRRLAGDGFRTGFAASVPFAAASPRGVAGASIGAAILNTIALSSLRPLRARDGVTTEEARARTARSRFFSTAAALERQLPG